MKTQRRFKAVKGFNYPATLANLKKAKADHTDPSIVWKRAEKGSKLREPCAELLKSWLANECVEEVKRNG